MLVQTRNSFKQLQETQTSHCSTTECFPHHD
ncbi:hypothetical protein LEMLEM_LOCUS20026 [Lemmus lemmus]